MELHKNWDFYKEIMEDVNEENVHFAEVYATTKEELIEKFLAWAEGWRNDRMVEEIEEGDIPVGFIGEGFYDLWGYDFGVGSITRIDEILKGEVDDIEVFTDPDKVKREIQREEGYVYAVWGVIHVKTPHERHLRYVVTSEKQLTDSEVYEVLMRNGVSPNAYGLSISTNEFANYTIQAVEDMDSDDLHEFIQQRSERAEVETFSGEF